MSSPMRIIINTSKKAKKNAMVHIVAKDFVFSIITHSHIIMQNNRGQRLNPGADKKKSGYSHRRWIEFGQMAISKSGNRIEKHVPRIKIVWLFFAFRALLIAVLAWTKCSKNAPDIQIPPKMAISSHLRIFVRIANFDPHFTEITANLNNGGDVSLRSTWQTAVLTQILSYGGFTYRCTILTIWQQISIISVESP